MLGIFYNYSLFLFSCCFCSLTFSLSISSCSFPALSCEFASVDVSDVLGTVSLLPQPFSLFVYSARLVSLVIVILVNRSRKHLSVLYFSSLWAPYLFNWKTYIRFRNQSSCYIRQFFDYLQLHLSYAFLPHLLFLMHYVSEKKPESKWFCLQNRLNITKTIRKFSIDPNLNPTGSEFHPGPIPTVTKHGDEADGEYGEGSVALTSATFDRYTHQ